MRIIALFLVPFSEAEVCWLKELPNKECIPLYNYVDIFGEITIIEKEMPLLLGIFAIHA